MTAISLVPSSRWDITSDRRASRALPPALRMTWASPSSRPSCRDGMILASMQVTTASRRAGGIGRVPRLNVLAYSELASSSSSLTDMLRISCVARLRKLGVRSQESGVWLFGMWRISQTLLAPSSRLPAPDSQLLAPGADGLGSGRLRRSAPLAQGLIQVGDQVAYVFQSYRETHQ